jgi:hypothetical protein
MADQGTEVPLRISFIGVKGVKWLSLGHNNLRPLLALFEDHLEQRVIFRKTRKYPEIEYVDVTRTDTDNLEIAYAGSGLTFACKLRNVQELPGVLRFFAGKGVKLGAGAQQRLKA